jgi:hypothetical protein
MQRMLTLRQLRDLVARIPDEHADRQVIVSVEAGCVREGLTDDWEVEYEYGWLVLHTTGDR